MNTKILLIAFSAVAITSCSTAYKSAQTPDDVYYSPVRIEDERKDDYKREERRDTYNADDSRTRMTIRDRRWRDLNDEYDYTYRNSPYNYSYCNCACNTGYGYYYNPFYYPRPLYQTTFVYKPAVNTTSRTVNLNAYKNYNQAVTYNPKAGSIGSSSMSNNGGIRPVRQYNNSNSESKVGRVIRQVITPSSNSGSSRSSSSSENNTRTYTPSSSGSSSSGSSSSGSSSSGGSVSRPGRG